MTLAIAHVTWRSSDIHLGTTVGAVIIVEIHSRAIPVVDSRSSVIRLRCFLGRIERPQIVLGALIMNLYRKMHQCTDAQKLLLDKTEKNRMNQTNLSFPPLATGIYAPVVHTLPVIGFFGHGVDRD